MDAEPATPARHTVYRSINKPLLFMGVDRRYFFFSVVSGAAIFNLLGSLLGAIGVFASLYAFSNWATRTDPQILVILLRPIMNPGKFHIAYDPGKFEPSRATVVDDPL